MVLTVLQIVSGLWLFYVNNNSKNQSKQPKLL